MTFDYDIFLDDIRLPPRPEPGEVIRPMIVCRNARAFRDTVVALGYPKFIHFDNDLGEAEEGRHLAKWLLERIVDDVEGGKTVPVIDWYVHSMNPIGAQAINDLMFSIRQYREQQNSQNGDGGEAQ